MSEIPTGQAYNSWWQFRLDMWSRLEEASGRLAAAAARGLPTDDLAKTVADLLDSLTPLEPFWAFPDQRRIAALATSSSRRVMTASSALWSVSIGR